MTKQQIIELEKRILYLEKYIDELNEVVIEQQKELDKHKKAIKNLEEKTKTFATENEVRMAEEKPPHY